MKQLGLKIINWLVDRLFPLPDPFPLKQKPVEWEQRHARRTAGEMLESQGQIIPPPRGKKRS